jgi:hypothetical protein
MPESPRNHLLPTASAFALVALCLCLPLPPAATVTRAGGLPLGRQDTRTPLHLAARDGDIEAARRLLAGGADIDARANGAHTPLMAAAAYGELEMVRFLLARGADPTLKDEDGRTAAERARQNGHAAVVRVFESIPSNRGSAAAGRQQGARADSARAATGGEAATARDDDDDDDGEGAAAPVKGDAPAPAPGKGAEGGCSFGPPPGTYTNQSPASEGLFRREIYDRYEWSVNGTITAPLRVGLNFLSLQVAKPYTNTVSIVPGRGAQRKNDAAPVNAAIYRVAAKYVVCEEYRSGVTRKLVEDKWECFVSRDKEWVCGSADPLNTKTTILDQE